LGGFSSDDAGFSILFSSTISVSLSLSSFGGAFTSGCGMVSVSASFISVSVAAGASATGIAGAGDSNVEALSSWEDGGGGGGISLLDSGGGSDRGVSLGLATDGLCAPTELLLLLQRSFLMRLSCITANELRFNLRSLITCSSTSGTSTEPSV
jgi:hypothetical protein